LLSPLAHERRKGNKIVGGEMLGNKHKPKPRAKPQECIVMVKKVCSLEEEHDDEEECDDDHIAPTSCTQEKREGSKTTGVNTKKQTQTKSKSKITRCNNGEKVCSLEEKFDDDCYYFHLLHIREERGEQDRKGGSTRKQNANQN